MIVMIDNYDSFTYNLVQYLNELKQEVVVYRNDAITPAAIEALKPERIVLSPGPGRPDSAGVTLEVIHRFAGKVPILGVCLGMQAIGQAFGAKIVHASSIKHGKTSQIHHQGEGMFAGFNSPYTATRYHSLVLARSGLPDCLQVTAWAEDEAGGPREIMAIRHEQYTLCGVQFHPESILTENGHALLQNFLDDKI